LEEPPRRICASAETILRNGWKVIAIEEGHIQLIGQTIVIPFEMAQKAAATRRNCSNQQNCSLIGG
jgi:hypothetical protein